MPTRSDPSSGLHQLNGHVLLTGAAGTLGRALRPALAQASRRLLLSDRLPVDWTLAGHERYVACDLSDRAGVLSLLDGVDAIVHLGAVSVEQPFDAVLGANIVGAFNLYEAARVRGVRRIVFASSNHVTGCYPRTERVAPTDPVRPDGYYGLSKAFGENLASLYFDRYGIETVCLRIGTATPRPPDVRGLSTWISLRDLDQLVLRALVAPEVGFTVVYGVSANQDGWWDNRTAFERLGYRPQDDAAAFRAEVESQPLPDYERDPGSPTARLQGGSFLAIGPYDHFGAAAPTP